MFHNDDVTIYQRFKLFFNSRNAHFLIIAIGGIMCFLPVLLGIKSNLENSSLADALSSTEAKLSGVVSLTLCLPLTIDLFIDNVQNYFLRTFSKNRYLRKEVTNKNLGIDVIDRFEVIMVIIANFVTYIVMFLPEETKNIALLFSCSRRCYFLLIFGSVSCSFNRYSNEDFPTLIISFMLVFFAIGSVSGVFSNNFDPTGKGVTNNYYARINFTFTYCVYGSIFILSSRWLVRSTIRGRKFSHSLEMSVFRLFKLSSNGKGTDNTAADDGSKDLLVNDPHLPFKIAYISSFVALLVMVAARAIQFKVLSGMDKKQLFMSSLPGAFLLLAILAVNTQKIKHAAVRNLVSKLFDN